jgi:methyl-accepting chemotaxis protein
MAKAKQIKVEEVKQIVLTEKQFEALNEIRSLLDSASDTLDDIDGDGNLYEIGKSVGDATSDIVKAFNELGDLIDDLDDQINDFDFEDEDEDDN